MRRVWTWVPVLTMALSLSARTGRAQDQPPVHPPESWRRLEGTFHENCSKCHQRLGESMARPVKEWRGSIHARNGVFCDTCHGGDPISTVLPIAMGDQRGFIETPTPKEIPAFCGRCHAEALKNFQPSKHGEVFETEDFEPNCVTCHNSHDVQEVSLNLISLDSACGKCHTASNINKGKIHQMKLALLEADQLVQRLYAQLDSLPATDPAIPGIRARLDVARKQVRRLAHAFSERTIRQRKAVVDVELARLQAIINFNDKMTR